jgi:type IV secretory pathway component VirB8
MQSMQSKMQSLQSKSNVGSLTIQHFKELKDAWQWEQAAHERLQGETEVCNTVALVLCMLFLSTVIAAVILIRLTLV